MLKEVDIMRGIIAVLFVFLIVAGGGGCATFHEKEPEEIVADGCKTEIDAFCKNVTIGEARMLACLYAYSDKLSNRCEYALYEVVSRLQRAVEGLSYAVNECHDDLNTYCADVKPGEGRLLQCLNKNKDRISARCKQAQKDIGLK
jgi:hypothetical protein